MCMSFIKHVRTIPPSQPQTVLKLAEREVTHCWLPLVTQPNVLSNKTVYFFGIDVRFSFEYTNLTEKLYSHHSQLF